MKVMVTVMMMTTVMIMMMMMMRAGQWMHLEILLNLETGNVTDSFYFGAP